VYFLACFCVDTRYENDRVSGVAWAASASTFLDVLLECRGYSYMDNDLYSGRIKA
jgi:hypothetical protein